MSSSTIMSYTKKKKIYQQQHLRAREWTNQIQNFQFNSYSPFHFRLFVFTTFHTRSLETVYFLFVERVFLFPSSFLNLFFLPIICTHLSVSLSFASFQVCRSFSPIFNFLSSKKERKKNKFINILTTTECYYIFLLFLWNGFICVCFLFVVVVFFGRLLSRIFSPHLLCSLFANASSCRSNVSFYTNLLGVGSVFKERKINANHST